MKQLYTTNKPIVTLALVVLSAVTAVIGNITTAIFIFILALLSDTVGE